MTVRLALQMFFPRKITVYRFFHGAKHEKNMESSKGSEWTMERVFFVLGTLSALVAVVAGAFGAHSLKGRLDPEMLSVFEVAVRYQMYHAFALIAAAWSQSRWPSRLVTIAGWLFVAGTLLFCGSLYLLSVSAEKWLGMATPFGGLAFVAGWGCLAWGAWRG
jgi:uncharacterized membrane protein YgdD (TMEM256/DUF423 family)